MIKPLGRSRRDSTLFQLAAKQLRAVMHSNRLRFPIDKQLDFAELTEPLED